MILVDVQGDNEAELAIARALQSAGLHCNFVQPKEVHQLRPQTLVQIVIAGSGQNRGSESIEGLWQTLRAKDEEISELNKNLDTAVASIKTFHKQQNELFEEFVSLRDKYDAHKEKSRALLWDYIPRNVTGFENIPMMNCKIVETEDRIGKWTTGKVLGEGQFAVVKEIIAGPGFSGKSKSGQLAVKRILKDKIGDVKNALRINNEVGIMRDLCHPNIVRMVEVLHTSHYLYIIQERGGLDLFEHYRKHSGPASESFARSLVNQLASVIDYLSQRNIVHRDLKPENILIAGPGCQVKLVDFGLSTKHEARMTIDDFCGTPGFFAPEMMLKETYSSYKLDVWGLGCVLLEVLLGHVRFAEVWMPCYSYENLHDVAVFDRELSKCIGAVRKIFTHGKHGAGTKQGPEHTERFAMENEELMFKNHRAPAACVKALHEQAKRSDACCDFILGLLAKDVDERASTAAMVAHPFILENLKSMREIGVETKKRDSFDSLGSETSLGSADPAKTMSPSNSPSPCLSTPSTSTSVGSASQLLSKRPSAQKVKPGLTIVTSGGHIEPEKVSSPDKNKSHKNQQVPLQRPGSPPKKMMIQCPNARDVAAERGRLPPLSPASPKVEGAAEIVKLGDALMRQTHDFA